MVTFDITNVYSKIHDELGKQNLSFWREKFPETLHPRFNKRMITDGIELILNNKFFHFDSLNYIRTSI